MKKTTRRYGALAGFASLLLMTPVMAQDDVEVRVEPVAGNIYALFAQGGNIGVSVGEDGVFMIDDQYAPLTAKIIAAIATLSDQPVRFLINTHYHGDHTGGNENMGKAGTVIIGHDNIRARLQARPLGQSGGWTEEGGRHGLPVITFNAEMSFHLNGDEARAVHFANGHTDGDSLIHFKGANVIHMGDLMFNGLYPYIDVDAGGSVDGMLAAYEAAIAMSDADTKIIPGHGPLSDRAGMMANRDMIQTVRDRVAAMIAEGKSMDEIVAAAPSAEFDEDYTWSFIGPERFVRSVYNSLVSEG